MNPEETNSAETKPQTARTRVANPQNPSAEELTAARAAHWHQQDNPLLSLETLREWVQRSGLVMYLPKPQLGAPGPSLVGATLGKPGTGELAEQDAAKNLLARLIAEGSVVPLNLLGVTGGLGTDTPDFVVSAAVFSYIFTLRGNKAWKQSPVTSGAVKVSPLALATYEMLSAKVTLSAYDLTTQLGKEVTEAAVLRALTELWSQLRVIPVPQQDGSTTLWELTTSRFTKQIKAGANAGQPSALSALISLYLGQAVIATEGEIESFLSALAPRSRVRDVIHALLSARQLETVVIDGKTLLHVAGELPAFAKVAAAEASEEEPVGDIEATGDDSGSRISKFAAKPGSKIGTGLRSKPAFGKPAFGSRPSFGSKPAYGSKPAFGKRPFGSKPAFGGGDRERRPFQQDSYTKPAFDKPWQENRPARPANDGEASGGEFKPAAGTYDRKPSGDRPSFAKRPSFGRPSFGDRGNGAGDSRPPRREFTPREGGSGEGPRKTFSKPGTFGRKREGGFAPKPSFGGGDSRSPRRDFGGSGERSERPAGGGFKRAPGSYSPRPSGGFSGGRSDHPAFGAKPGFSRDRPSEGGEAPRKVFRKFDAPRTPKPFDGERPKRSFDGPRPERAGTFDRPRGERPSFDRPVSDRPRSDRPSFGAKPGGFGAKKPFGAKPGGFAKSGSQFAKFAEGKKPFRKPGAPKKPGGFGPTKRRRDEDGK